MKHPASTVPPVAGSDEDLGRTNDGGPAFTVSTGMSLRDYFAARALTGLLACASGEDFEDQKQLRDDYAAYCLNFAESAYAMADAMLKARAA